MQMGFVHYKTNLKWLVLPPIIVSIGKNLNESKQLYLQNLVSDVDTRIKFLPNFKKRFPNCFTDMFLICIKN